MANRKMERIGRNGLVALMLMYSFTKICVKASLEVNETQQHHPTNVYHDLGITRNKIVTAQFECYQKIMKDNPSDRLEPMCNRTWDGWLCWDDTKAGITSEQHCPDYFQDFDPSEMVTKICTDSGQWFLHPESNRTWTNYTRCNEHTSEGRVTAMNLFYLALIGHGLSLTSLFVSLGIFFHFKSLSCQRITLHKNLFFSFVLNSVITIIWLTAVANNQELVQRNPTSCKVSQFIHLYLFGCNYFWMLCEGIYLHTLIVVAVFAEKQHLMWYYLLGWGFPLIPASIHAIARSYYYNDNCWISSKTSLLYIIHGPICAALLSAHHQAQGDPSSRVEPLHEGRESNSHPGTASGHPICPASLQAGGAGFLRNLRLHHAHTDALPGPSSFTAALEPVQPPVWQQHRKPFGRPALGILHGFLHHRGARMLQHRRPIGTHERQRMPRHGCFHPKDGKRLCLTTRCLPTQPSAALVLRDHQLPTTETGLFRVEGKRLHTTHHSVTLTWAH
ncbi:calcitonin gene-related peptide type 1 receptor isoform X1 [Phyllopteryx taeniolatus]|uniref:calcitonin gene-related peptide type 1 receptor isoform X1 n=1 Tax=Phyllopteryx taeniolatus TaxID=161469 RepID=UPI002AD254EF|nr:calcitonin gene-related peptide type 1 receptor isoform X1 [Phyllopteryx taeniolatus]